MSKIIIHLIAAARPNFMKIAPAYHALKKAPEFEPKIVHTGQHYDFNMSDAFFRDLDLPEPDFHLGVGSGSHAEQTAGVMIAYEKVCLEHRPDWVVVPGDVNSTIACTLAVKKLNIPVAHLEAGLRSGDRTMPEELNRLLTDSISDLLWTPSLDADENLLREGVPAERIDLIGNIMLDSFEALKPAIESSRDLSLYDVQENGYAIVTLHRPANVDSIVNLNTLVDELCQMADRIPVIFPVHPRTRQKLLDFDLWQRLDNIDSIKLIEPLGYQAFMGLVTAAKLVVTDSGGLQEETTYLGIPCITVRTTTERPITISHGTNKLAAVDEISSCLADILAGNWPTGQRPEFWDGKTADRLVDSLRRVCNISIEG